MNEEISMVRKVYVLPKEMVDRIAAFQEDKRLPSEVEAVRRLLDEALMYRDTPELIVQRFKDRLAVDGIPSSVARDVLVGHPLVKTIGQEEQDAITFAMRDGRVFRVWSNGRSEELDTDYNGYGEKWDEFPPKPKAIAKQPAPDFDDEIPF